MKDYETAASLMRTHSDLCLFVGGRPDSLVAAAQSVLGVVLPPTYRRFVTEFGAGFFGVEEIFGLTTDRFESDSVPNGVWYTLQCRGDFDLPKYLVVIGVGPYGETYCLDSSQVDAEGESPVVGTYVGLPPSDTMTYAVAADFGTFLRDIVEAELHRHQRAAE